MTRQSIPNLSAPWSRGHASPMQRSMDYKVGPHPPSVPFEQTGKDRTQQNHANSAEGAFEPDHDTRHPSRNGDLHATRKVHNEAPAYWAPRRLLLKVGEREQHV